jgi:hypothetical protein
VERVDAPGRLDWWRRRDGLRELLADAESRRLRGHVQSAGSGTPRAPSASSSVLGLSNRAAMQLAAQLLRRGAHILQFLESAPAA